MGHDHLTATKYDGASVSITLPLSKLAAKLFPVGVNRYSSEALSAAEILSETKQRNAKARSTETENQNEEKGRHRRLEVWGKGRICGTCI